jgi:hypothetical protein
MWWMDNLVQGYLIIQLIICISSSLLLIDYEKNTYISDETRG